MSENALVRGQRPSWVTIEERRLTLVQGAPTVDSSADETNATVGDFVQELGAFARAVADLAPADHASEGTVDPYPQEPELQQAVAVETGDSQSVAVETGDSQ